MGLAVSCSVPRTKPWAPSRGAPSSGVGVVAVEGDPGELAEPVEELRAPRRCTRAASRGAPIRATASASRTRRCRRWAPSRGRRGRGRAAAARRCPSPRSAAGRRARLARRRGHGDVKPPTSLIASRDALESSGWWSTSQWAAVDAAGLLVGEEGEDEVARRLACRSGPGGAAMARIIASMSFMSTAPRPQMQPSRTSAANGSTCQSAAFAGTTSRWPCTSEGRAARGPRPRAARRRWRGPARSRQIVGSRPDLGELARRRTRRPPAPPARSRRRSWTESIRMRSRQMRTTSSAGLVRRGSMAPTLGSRRAPPAFGRYAGFAGSEIGARCVLTFRRATGTPQRAC